MTTFRTIPTSSLDPQHHPLKALTDSRPPHPSHSTGQQRLECDSFAANVPHYHTLTERSAELCAEYFARLHDEAELSQIVEQNAFVHLQAELCVKLIEIGEEVLHEIDELIASSDELDNCVFTFGCQLHIAISLFELFRILYFSDAEIFSLELLKWYMNYGKSSSENCLTVEHTYDALIDNFITEMLVFNLKNSSKLLTIMKSEKLLSMDDFEKLNQILIKCPVLIEEDLPVANIDFEEKLALWRDECEKISNDSQFSSDHPKLKTLLRFLKGDTHLFSELASYIYIKDAYKLHMIKQIHSNFFVSRDDFFEALRDDFADENLDDYFTYELAIVSLMRGEWLMFFNYSVSELGFWWMPMHLVHLIFIYQNLSPEIFSTLETVILKHLESVRAMKKSFWRIAVMMAKELLSNPGVIVEEILMTAQIESLNDMDDMLKEAAIFEIDPQPLINIQTNHLLQQENFEEAFHLYNYIEEKDKFYFQLGNILEKIYKRTHKFADLTEIPFSPPKNYFIDLNIYLQMLKAFESDDCQLFIEDFNKLEATKVVNVFEEFLSRIFAHFLTKYLNVDIKKKIKKYAIIHFADLSFLKIGRIV